MYQLSILSATSFVRTALDDLETVEEIGLLVDADAVNLHRIVINSICEAVVKTHLEAHPSMLSGNIETVSPVAEEETPESEGESGQLKEENPETAEPAFKAELEDGVVTITMQTDTLRVVSVQASDSPVVVGDIYPELSAEGRKQLSKYVRGVSDDPRVIMQQRWADVYKPRLKYYSTEEDVCPTMTIEYIPYPELKEETVLISHLLEYAVLNELVAMILDSLKEHEKASLYRAKSQAIMKGEQ